MAPRSDPSLLDAGIDTAIAQLQAVRSLAEPLADAARLVSRCLVPPSRSGVEGKLLTCGNGGSAADAAHLAAELVGRFKSDRRPFPAICLNEAGPTLTAIGNDYGFDQVFSRQVEAFGRDGDVLIGFTTSGKSMNLKRAFETAADKGLDSIAFLGRDGGDARGLATVELLVHGKQTSAIQQAHLLLYHTLCEMIEPELQRG